VTAVDSQVIRAIDILSGQDLVVAKASCLDQSQEAKDRIVCVRTIRDEQV
jgi:hypothetical protein